MNKKIYTILLISIVALLSLSSASAWWIFGDNEEVKTINFTGNETMTMYGTDTPAGKHSMNPLGIVSEEGDVYYMDMATFEDLCAYSPEVKDWYNYWLGKDPQGTYEFELDDKPFTAEYKTNQTVGLNENANVITKIYYPNGTEIDYKQE